MTKTRSISEHSISHTQDESSAATNRTHQPVSPVRSGQKNPAGYSNSAVHYIAKAAVDILLYSGILTLIVLWFFARPIGETLALSQSQLIFFMAVLYLSGLFAVYLLFQLHRMFQTLLGGDPFVSENVTCLRKMAVSCALIAGCYAIKVLFLFSIATLIITLIFVIGCLFCLTLKDVFKQAIAFKEENDLTI